MPLQTFTLAGDPIFDSDTCRPGVFMGHLSSSAGSVIQASFPEFPFGTLHAFNVGGGVSRAATVDYTLGYPRVTLPQVAGHNVFLWMLNDGPSSVSASKFYIANASGGLVASVDGYMLYHLGTVSDASPSPQYIQTPAYTDGGGVWHGTAHRFRFLGELDCVYVVELDLGVATGITKADFAPSVNISGSLYVEIIVHREAGHDTGVKVHQFGRAPVPSTPPVAYFADESNKVKWDFMRATSLQTLGIHHLDRSAPNNSLTYDLSYRVGVVVTPTPRQNSTQIRSFRWASSGPEHTSINYPLLTVGGWADSHASTGDVFSCNLIDLTSLP